MQFVFETLESRRLLSGLTPAQVQQAYGFNQVTFNDQGTIYNGTGRGETIAIVDADTAPTIVADLGVFDAMYSLPNTDANRNPVLTVVTPQGTPAASATWAQEITLDVESAHAIAPKAHILLVQAKSPSFVDLFAAVDFARRQPGVGVVSVSWVGAEFSGEKQYDTNFTTVPGHRPVTFVAATGDSGLGTVYPASSPNVVAVGGTTLNVNAQGDYISESAWSLGGGGHSTMEGTYTPTVSYDGNPNTGFFIYDSTTVNGQTGWQVDAGTSGGAPQWAALFAIADQGRSYVNNQTLDGPSQSVPAMASLAAMDLHDITTGSNGKPAKAGFDQATGWGTPMANKIIPDLVTFGSTGSIALAAAATSIYAPPVTATVGQICTNKTQAGADDWLEDRAGVLVDAR